MLLNVDCLRSDYLLHSVPEMLVEVNAIGLERARLLWLNIRFLFENGFEVYSTKDLQKLRDMFLHDFAVMIPFSGMQSASNSPPTRTLFADRYGGTQGSPHGGSGRCAMLGNYNAKGIGKTPLTPDNVDWWHSTGLMWLSEGIREAISAEVAQFELPHGAVPIVAIIDTNIDVQRDAVSRKERCGIVVRLTFYVPHTLSAVSILEPQVQKAPINT